MQSDSVFRVLTGFIVLFAVAGIGGAAFNLAKRGFVGKYIWRDAIRVTRHVVKRRYKSNCSLSVLYVACIVVMYIGYGVVVHRQNTGYYLCKAVYLQFDDEVSKTRHAVATLSYLVRKFPTSSHIGHDSQTSSSSFDYILIYAPVSNGFALSFRDLPHFTTTHGKPVRVHRRGFQP